MVDFPNLPYVSNINIPGINSYSGINLAQFLPLVGLCHFILLPLPLFLPLFFYRFIEKIMLDGIWGSGED